MKKRIQISPIRRHLRGLKRDNVNRQSAFSLIELIGVLAIMAIIAGAVAPNVLKSIDRAAVISEVSTANALGDQVKKYLHDYGTPPPLATWNTQIATYASISPADVLTTKRAVNRAYVWDAVAAPTRAMIISSMWNGLAIPAVTVAQFNTVWNTQDGQIPALASWAGWAGRQDYLTICRINFNTESRAIVLQNLSTQTGAPFAPAGKAASYQVVPLKGPVGAIISIPAAFPTAGPNPNPANLTLIADERINLFNSTGVLVYTYVVNVSGKTFNFDGNYWTAP